MLTGEVNHTELVDIKIAEQEWIERTARLLRPCHCDLWQHGVPAISVEKRKTFGLYRNANTNLRTL